MTKSNNRQDLKDTLEHQLNQKLEELDKREDKVNTNAKDGYSI